MFRIWAILFSVVTAMFASSRITHSGAAALGMPSL